MSVLLQPSFPGTSDALAYLDKSDGWEIGVGPTVVIMDEGRAKANAFHVESLRPWHPHLQFLAAWKKPISVLTTVAT